MPLKMYCPNTDCCAPIEYSLDKPRFCPMCGRPLNSSSASKASTAALKSVDKPIEKPLNIESPLEVDKMEFEGQIEKFETTGNIKLGDLANQGKTGFVRDIPKKINKKKQIEMFRAEANRPARVDIQDAGAE